MAPGNDHRDVPRVFQFNTIFIAGVPATIRRRKFSVAFDLGWSRAVTIHSPMGDIAVMTDPVEQLTATGVVVPAPIAMNSLFDVRHHLRRSDPGVVV